MYTLSASMSAQKVQAPIKEWFGVAVHDARLLPQALVAPESAGGHKIGLIAALLRDNVSGHRADPRAACYFIRSLGKRGKCRSQMIR